MEFDRHARALSSARSRATHFVSGSVFSALLGLAVPAAALGSVQEPVQPERYVRAQTKGAALYNLPDVKAEVVARAGGGTLLAIYGETAGYLEAEPPGGLTVWIFGDYVRATEQPGLVEITGNNVLMRPLPNSQERSYPLAQRLDKGDRVRVLGRADASKPIEQDWIQIASPPGTRAWVPAGETAALAPGEEGSALWSSAVKDAQAALKPVALVEAGSKAPSKSGAAAPQASSAAGSPTSTPISTPGLEQAEKLMTAAIASETPDFRSARAAYEKVLRETPQGTAADKARLRLEEIAAREEILKIKADAQVAEARRKDELVKADARLREANLGSDPLWGRFQARGWLEKEGERWVVRWAGETVADVVCTSGRYELANYAGYEVGLSGLTLRSAVPASASNQAAPAKIDAKRIEVISGRGRT